MRRPGWLARFRSASAAPAVAVIAGRSRYCRHRAAGSRRPAADRLVDARPRRPAQRRATRRPGCPMARPDVVRQLAPLVGRSADAHPHSPVTDLRTDARPHALAASRPADARLRSHVADLQTDARPRAPVADLPADAHLNVPAAARPTDASPVAVRRPVAAAAADDAPSAIAGRTTAGRDNNCPSSCRSRTSRSAGRSPGRN